MENKQRVGVSRKRRGANDPVPRDFDKLQEADYEGEPAPAFQVQDRPEGLWRYRIAIFATAFAFAVLLIAALLTWGGKISGAEFQAITLADVAGVPAMVSAVYYFKNKSENKPDNG